MKKQYWIFPLILLLLLVGCQKAYAGDDATELNGRIALWHSWSSSETAVLDEALAEFEQIHPNVKVITVALPPDQLLQEFEKAGSDGLGPDLLIGKDSWISELADAGLIRSSPVDDRNAPFFNSRNRKLVQYENKLMGVPFSLAPYALYYNKDIVEMPATSLDELLLEAESGNGTAFVPRFEEAYWGIGAFGDGLFDSQNRFTLAESGFEEWLTWLNAAQEASGIILNVDDVSLLDLFTNGEVAYYVAGPEKQAQIASMIDEENPFEIGVIPLPEGPIGVAEPLLPAETVLLYAFSSEEQTKIANALTTFLVNQQQSIRFMRELARVPANPTVRVDQRIYPLVYGFFVQARTAVVIPNEIPTDPFVAAGNRAYVSVLSGILTPAEAVCQFGIDVATLQQYANDEMSLPADCELPTDQTAPGENNE